MKKTTFFFSCFLMAYSTGVSAFSEAIQQLQHHSVEFVHFCFCDIFGNLKEIIVPTHDKKSLENRLQQGLFFDGSSVPGYSSIDKSDLLLKPDVTSLHINAETRQAYVLCDVYATDTDPFEGDPRCILKRELEKARSVGITINIGAELEFFIFNKSQTAHDITPIDSYHYCDALKNAHTHKITYTLLRALLNAGIPVEKLHHEVAEGQYEIVLRYADALTTADTIILAKHILSTVAENEGFTVSFMPKPFVGKNGSGMHMHFSAADTNTATNLFYSKNELLSDFGKQFFAGILTHITEFSALFNPSINSYKRLVPGYEAPLYICWACKNRSALIRVPQVNGNHPEAVRGELRCPDATCNPHLACSALIKMGMQGVANQYKVPAPVEKSLFTLSLDELHAQGITTLPDSLSQALENLGKSPLARELLTGTLFNTYLTLKKEECAQFTAQHPQDTPHTITPWEFTGS